MKLVPHRYLKIILVEDNETDATMVIEAIKKHKMNFHVDWLKDGTELMEYLESSISSEDKPLVLLDINMPLKRGDECLKEMHQNGMGNFPVIVLTSSSDLYEFDALYKLGANACITKPDTFEDYQQLVKSIELFWSRYVILPSVSSLKRH